MGGRGAGKQIHPIAGDSAAWSRACYAIGFSNNCRPGEFSSSSIRISQEETERMEAYQRADPFGHFTEGNEGNEDPFSAYIMRFVPLVIFCAKVWSRNSPRIPLMVADTNPMSWD
jgi:hypothetical protein